MNKRYRVTFALTFPCAFWIPRCISPRVTRRSEFWKFQQRMACSVLR